jgi:hypothetical protein
MAGDLITSDFQMQFGTLLLGAGTPYEIDAESGLVGWDDLPGMDTADVPRPSAPGDYAGTVYPQGRIVTCQLSVHGDGPGHAANIAALRAATTAALSVETPLAVRLAGQVTYISAKCLQRSIPTGVNYAAGATPKAVLQFKATDPRRYVTSLTSVSTAPPTSSGGVTWPITWPVTWSTLGSGGGVSVVNTGDFDTPPVITIRGPLTTPFVVRQDTSDVLEFNTTLAASDTIVVDVLAETVTLNGTTTMSLLTDRSAPVSSFRMPPGTTGLLLREAAGPDPTASMTVAYRSAYL